MANDLIHFPWFRCLLLLLGNINCNLFENLNFYYYEKLINYVWYWQIKNINSSNKIFRGECDPPTANTPIRYVDGQNWGHYQGDPHIVSSWRSSRGSFWDHNTDDSPSSGKMSNRCRWESYPLNDDSPYKPHCVLYVVSNRGDSWEILRRINRQCRTHLFTWGPPLPLTPPHPINQFTFYSQCEFAFPEVLGPF